jgi:hypothetical protein
VVLEEDGDLGPAEVATHVNDGQEWGAQKVPPGPRVRIHHDLSTRFRNLFADIER